MNDATERTVARWEKHLQTAISAVAIGLMFWIGGSLMSVKEDIAGMKVSIVQALEIRKEVAVIRNDQIKMLLEVNSLRMQVEKYDNYN